MLRFLIMFLLSGMIIADDHKIPESFEDCEGRIANYYVAKLTPRGSLEGWYKATEMHREYYQCGLIDHKSYYCSSSRCRLPSYHTETSYASLFHSTFETVAFHDHFERDTDTAHHRLTLPHQ